MVAVGDKVIVKLDDGEENPVGYVQEVLLNTKEVNVYVEELGKK
jgi:hypothetical protein